MTELDYTRGTLSGAGRKFAIVAARFNETIVDQLVRGARATLSQHGVGADDVTLVQVPGCFELPFAVRRVANAYPDLDGVIALGTVIRGATAHFDYVAGECASGLARVALELDLPVSFGVLTTETIEQAIERSGTKAGNKGADAALTALEMAGLSVALGGG
ncbi:MAG: 6,7-dimethyl-8-ribityllumazine synthase [Pseudomonadota bacterium]